MDNLIFLDRGIWGLFISPCDPGNPISPRWQRLGLREKKKDKKKDGASRGGGHGALRKGGRQRATPCPRGTGTPCVPRDGSGRGRGFGAPPPLRPVSTGCVSPHVLGWHWGWGQPPAHVSSSPPPGSHGVPGCRRGGGRGTAALRDSSCGGTGANYPGGVTSPPNPALLGAAPCPPAA